jgi:hypothetical protein
MKRAMLIGLLLTGVAIAQQYTKEGALVFPKDYRSWVFLSSVIGMTYSDKPAASPQFDNVFVNPTALTGFLKSGAWPDKTVLITERRRSASHAANKDGKFQTDLLGFEVHIKDASRGGWNFYAFRKDAAIGEPFPKSAACFTCHAKNGATDTTFVQFYPTLIEAAKRFGKFNDPGEVR